MLRPRKTIYERPSLHFVAVVILMVLLPVPTIVVLTAGEKDRLKTESQHTVEIFSDPTNLGPTVNSSAAEYSPSISADRLELYFVSYRPGGLGGADIWVTTRRTKEVHWSTPKNLGPTVNSSDNDNAPSISVDGLTLYFSSDRTDGHGGRDLWITTRKTTGDAWSEPVNLGPMVNSSAHEHGPSISSDDLSLFFSGYSDSKLTRPGGIGGSDLWVTTRETKANRWTKAVNLGPKVNYSGRDAAPSISADGLSLYFNSSRPGGFGDVDLWVTMRKTKDDLWGTPFNLGSTVNSAKRDLNPDISADGSTLYFVSMRPGSVGDTDNMDIWQVTLKKHTVKDKN